MCTHSCFYILFIYDDPAVSYCRLHEDKMSKLQSPNFRVSDTRLIVYNVPKTKNERDLKKLFLNAVISRATKQKPVIRQVGAVISS